MRLALLFVLPFASFAASAASAAAPAVVNVELSNFKFDPKAITMEHGQSYVLRLHNAADGGHDFTAGEFFAAAVIADEDRRLVAEGGVEVPSGQVREIHLTAPAAAGHYKLKCTHSFHKMFGMSGEIVVR